jgi:hypothetical protein
MIYKFHKKQIETGCFKMLQDASRCFKHKRSLETHPDHTSMTCSSSSERDALISSQDFTGYVRYVFTERSAQPGQPDFMQRGAANVFYYVFLCLLGSWPKSFQNLLNETETCKFI